MARSKLWQTRLLNTTLAAVLLVGVSLAAAKGKGILFPDWSAATAGSYAKPSAEIGKKVPMRTVAKVVGSVWNIHVTCRKAVAIIRKVIRATQPDE